MSTVQDAAGDYVADEVDYQRRLREMRLWNYAEAYGLPFAPPNQTATPAPAPASPPAGPAAAAPPTNGGSSLLKTAALAAGMATGGAGLLTAGLMLGNLFNKPAAPVVQPTPDGQVTIGISTDGQLINPNAPAVGQGQ